MIWVQAGVSFALWIGYGAWLARKTAAMRKQFCAVCAVRRKIYGPLLMIVGAALMLIGLMIVAIAGGIVDGSMLPWAWLTVSFSGLLFVHAQTVATAMILSTLDAPVTEGAGCAFEPTQTPEHNKDAKNTVPH